MKCGNLSAFLLFMKAGEMMRRIKIAQIGTSETEHAIQVFRSLNSHPDVFDVIGYANVDQHSKPLHEVFNEHRRLTVDEILHISDLDAVVIECDENLQSHYAMLAAQRNLPMHLEKPCGDDDAAFNLLIDEVEKRKLLLHTGYMYRYNPAVQYALEAVKSGKLGEVYSVEAQMSCMQAPAMRRWLGNYRGGMMFYLGCHLVDLIMLFQGEPMAITPLNMTVTEDSAYGEDFGMALFRYPHGMSIAKTCGAEPGGFMRRQLVICGTKGTLEIKPLERLLGGDMVSTSIREHYVDENGACSWSNEGKLTVYEPYNRYDSMMLSFADMLRGKKENPYTPEYERALHRNVLRACGKIA